MKARFFSLLLIALFYASVIFGADLRFRSDGTFKIMQVTDTHVRADSAQTKRTVALLTQMLDAEHPDLVVFTGDIVTKSPYQRGFEMLVKPVQERKIPWALVFGNHDREQDLTYQQMADMLEAQPYNVGRMQPVSGVDGYGNYDLAVKDPTGKKTEAVIYCLDSHSYMTLPTGKGDDARITFSQMNWYAAQSDAYTKANGGKPVPSLAFFHIPIPEYRAVYQEQGHKRVGNYLEEPCSPEINSGFFTLMTEKGDVMGVFVGHDHVNDYIFNYYGIALAYGRNTADNGLTYGWLKGGVRIIELLEGKRSFNTWIRLTDKIVQDKVNFPADLPM